MVKRDTKMENPFIGEAVSCGCPKSMLWVQVGIVPCAASKMARWV